MYHHLGSTSTPTISLRNWHPHSAADHSSRKRKDRVLQQGCGKRATACGRRSTRILSPSPLPPPSPPSGFRAGHCHRSASANSHPVSQSSHGESPRVRQRTGFESGTEYFISRSPASSPPPPSFNTRIGNGHLGPLSGSLACPDRGELSVALCPALRVECSPASP